MGVNTVSTAGSQSIKVSQPCAQLKVRFDLLQAPEAGQTMDVLYHPDIQLLYDEKSCGFAPVTPVRQDTSAPKTLEAGICLKDAPLHSGQFRAANIFELRNGHKPLGLATVVEVLDEGFRYWDWKERPRGGDHFAEPFTTDQLDCFLLLLEFELLELPFLKDYSIRRARSGNYAYDIRLATCHGSLAHQQALMILDVLRGLPGEYCCLKPGFYQLSGGRQLENFECHFIIGSGRRSLTGRLMVL